MSATSPKIIERPTSRCRAAAAILCAAALLVGAPPARADMIAFSCTAGGRGNKVQLTAIQARAGGPCVGFRVKDARGRTRVVPGGFAGSGTVVASADGRSVVFIADNAYANVVRGKLMIYNQRHPGRRGKKLWALVFFRDGSRVARYSLRQLLQRVDLVGRSTSHISWVADRAWIHKPLRRKLRLTTTSYRELTFDTVSGKLLTTRDSATWRRCPTIVYGKVTRGKGSWTMRLARAHKGTVPKQLLVSGKRARAQRKKLTGYRTLCLRKRGKRFELLSVLRNSIN